MSPIALLLDRKTLTVPNWAQKQIFLCPFQFGFNSVSVGLSTFTIALKSIWQTLLILPKEWNPTGIEWLLDLEYKQGEKGWVQGQLNSHG